MREVPRFLVFPTRNRHKWVTKLVEWMSPQCDGMLILDNGSDPPVDEWLESTADRVCPVHVLADEEQPPNIARFFNLLFDGCEKLATGLGAWDVAVVNDDTLIPAGWLDIVCEALREHPTAVAAHTGGPLGRVTEPYLLTKLTNDSQRMCPHAFVIRGEVGLRADESLRWWYQDTDLDWQARLAGGVLGVVGPRTDNALAFKTTVGPLADQAIADEATFLAKWQIERVP